jgi:hypothetical protein
MQSYFTWLSLCFKGLVKSGVPSAEASYNTIKWQRGWLHMASIKGMTIQQSKTASGYSLFASLGSACKLNICLLPVSRWFISFLTIQLRKWRRCFCETSAAFHRTTRRYIPKYRSPYKIKCFNNGCESISIWFT